MLNWWCFWWLTIQWWWIHILKWWINIANGNLFLFIWPRRSLILTRPTFNASCFIIDSVMIGYIEWKYISMLPNINISFDHVSVVTRTMHIKGCFLLFRKFFLIFLIELSLRVKLWVGFLLHLYVLSLNAVNTKFLFG